MQSNGCVAANFQSFDPQGPVFGRNAQQKHTLLQDEQDNKEEFKRGPKGIDFDDTIARQES